MFGAWGFGSIVSYIFLGSSKMRIISNNDPAKMQMLCRCTAHNLLGR